MDGVGAYTMVDKWNKVNKLKLILGKTNTVVNVFDGDKYVGMKDKRSNNNINVMNELSDWIRYKVNNRSKSVEKLTSVDGAVDDANNDVNNINDDVNVNVNNAANDITDNINDVANDKFVNINDNHKQPITSHKRNIYKPTSDIFDFNILHIFSSERTIFITRKCVPCDNIFYYNFHSLHYPITARKYANPILNNNTKLIKYKQHNRTLISCFDDVNRECADKVLDLNEGLYLVLYSDLKSIFVNNKVPDTVIRPERYREREHSWILREMMDGFIDDLVMRFNKRFKVNAM